MKTGIITTDTYLNHDTGQGHPERADRVSVVIENLKKNKKLIWKKPLKFDTKYLKIAHESDYIDEVENSFPKKGLHFLDGDTIVSPGSRQASSDAVASIITAIDSVQNKEFKNVFCPVRQPGHHAEKDKAMGVCIYNNVAVGAHYLLEKYKLNKIFKAVTKANKSKFKVSYEVSGEAFLTKPNKTTYMVQNIVKKVTGLKPKLSTSGGTSDARFIKNIAPCLEFGLVGKTMHKIDESVSVSDLKKLTKIYENILVSYFK